MSDFRIRTWTAEDRPQLKALWQIAFGDSENYIDAFMESFLKPDTCLVAEQDSKVVSAMYILSSLEFHLKRKTVLSAGYTYALATLPEYRGRGIGSAVYKACSDLILKSSDISCVLPAQSDLYPFYEESSGAKPVSFVRESVFSRADLEKAEPFRAMRVTAIDYSRMRDALLSDKPHVSFPDAFFTMMESSGMEFMMLESGLAAAETIDGICYIRELLDPTDNTLRSAAGVAYWCSAEQYVVRTPLFTDGPGVERPYMLAVRNPEPVSEIPAELWWGFGLE